MRTLCDLKPWVDRLTFERAVGEAERSCLCAASEVDELMPGGAATANEFEQRFLSLCDRHAISRPQCQAQMGSYRVDFLWSAQSLIVETDGHATHGTRTAFESDRFRDVELTTAGYRVLRFTWRQLTEGSDLVAGKVERALGRR